MKKYLLFILLLFSITGGFSQLSAKDDLSEIYEIGRNALNNYSIEYIHSQIENKAYDKSKKDSLKENFEYLINNLDDIASFCYANDFEVFYDRYTLYREDNPIESLEEIKNQIKTEKYRQILNTALSEMTSIQKSNEKKDFSNIIDSKSNSANKTGLTNYIIYSILFLLIITSLFLTLLLRKEKMNLHESIKDIEDKNSKIKDLNKQLKDKTADIEKLKKGLTLKNEEIISLTKQVNSIKIASLTIKQEEVIENPNNKSNTDRCTENKIVSNITYIGTPSLDKPISNLDIIFNQRAHYYEFEIDQLEPTNASFRISNLANIDRMMGLPNSYITPACECNSTNFETGKKIQTIKDGKLQKRGNEWFLVEKSIIQII